ncbi:hypothetical protein ACEWY4_019605 [Coilia grayii]|uniref:Ig-like domain-containing protein n=1 Tax=Coilia grayii TaxID=363190 RepID=A0ABD1JAE2_9TELE
MCRSVVVCVCFNVSCVYFICLKLYFILIFFTDSSAAVSDEDDFVFGVIGSSVTITSQVQGHREFSSILWYHETIMGDIHLFCIFTNYTLHGERFIGTLPDSSGKTLLTISNAKVSDTGRYFVILEFGKIFTSGSTQYFIVTDTSDPVVTLYRGTDALGSPMFLCEVTGASGDWSGPWWLIEGEKGWLEGTTGKRMGSDGVFTRWSTLRLNSTVNVSCACHYQNKTSFLVRSSELDVSMGSHSACDLLIILSPLCLLLMLFTLVLVMLWARRVRVRRL